MLGRGEVQFASCTPVLTASPSQSHRAFSTCDQKKVALGVHRLLGETIRGELNVVQRLGVFARCCKRPNLLVIAPPIICQTFGLPDRVTWAEKRNLILLENNFPILKPETTFSFVLFQVPKKLSGHIPNREAKQAIDFGSAGRTKHYSADD